MRYFLRDVAAHRSFGAPRIEWRPERDKLHLLAGQYRYFDSGYCFCGRFGVECPAAFVQHQNARRVDKLAVRDTGGRAAEKAAGYIDGRKCHCFEKLIVQYLYSQSNLKDVLEHENFSHFNLDFYPDDYTEEATGETPRDNMRHVLETVKSYLSGFSDTPGNLLLYGNTGVGKTFLTNCIAKELLDKSHTVVYLTSLKLFDILESCKFDRDLSQTQKNASLSYLLSSDLLIIDDLGTELNNSFTSSQLYHCIDTRLTNHRSTIISTNLSFDDLRERYSERIFSRITSNYTLLKITGDDIRLKKAIMQH